MNDWASGQPNGSDCPGLNGFTANPFQGVWQR